MINKNNTVTTTNHITEKILIDKEKEIRPRLD